MAFKYLSLAAPLFVLALILSPVQASQNSARDALINSILSNLTVEELVHQVHLTFADNVIGQFSHNELYDSYIGDRGIGVIHDWYPTNSSQYNDLQALNLQKMRVPIPFLQTGECLHGVGSFKHSIFPQQIGIAATFHPDMAYKVGRAIGTEARAIGIHACFSPVLDLAKEPRWGRAQENFGEDYFLTSMMGVAYASGLSKNQSWSDPDAVVPVMKHFAAHGSPSNGLNAAPYMGYGLRQVMSEMLVPFKAVVQLGGARGVMMAYHDIDGVPSVVNPDLYNALNEWNFDGFVLADDTAMAQLHTSHGVAPTQASAIAQWFNAGGGIQFYDFPLENYTAITVDIVNNGTLAIETLRERARGVLNTKWDLGLFNKSVMIPDGIDSQAIANSDAHRRTALDAARESLVLLENRHQTLPIDPQTQNIRHIALIGPFADTLNFGDYSGPWGQNPIDRAITVRAAMQNYADSHGVKLTTSWGANSFVYNGQYPIAPDLLSSPNGTRGGLQATYFSDTAFRSKEFVKFEPPNRNWGLYPPNGLPSNNFSLIYEGSFRVPDGADVDGWIGLGIGANTTAKLFVDGKDLVDLPISLTSTFLSDIPGIGFTAVNSTLPPPGSSPFTFLSGSTHSIRIEYSTFNLAKKFENVNSINSWIQLYWNLVDKEDPVEKAVNACKGSDLVIFVGGANWNSDGENGDRGSLGLSPNQTLLVDALLGLEKPIVMVLEGGRPFAIPEYYSKAAAVLLAYFPGQSGGQAVADALFGTFTPGGRIPISIPSSSGSIPAFYNFKRTAHGANYTDVNSFPSYSFGYGLSYSTFSRSHFFVTTTNPSGNQFFGNNDMITFHVTVTNTGGMDGSDVPQVYLLQRFSSVVQPVKQLVGFERVFLGKGESKNVSISLDPSRFLMTLNRNWEWELEQGMYTFALCDSGSLFTDLSVNATLEALG